MNADVLYALLMSFGWLFLVGWLALLLIACRLAFRSEDNSGQNARFAGGSPKTANVTGRWNIHLRG